MTGPRLGHVILYVDDLAASTAFYRDVVGLAHRFTDAGYAEFDTGPTRFALYERRRAEQVGQQGLHARAGEERGRVVAQNERGADQPRVPVGGEEVEEGAADLVGVHPLILRPPT